MPLVSFPRSHDNGDNVITDDVSVPGRSCPLRYRYGASAIAAAPLIEAETLYVVGGLYGNVEALDMIEKLVSTEAGKLRVCFNGDFNWFNVDDHSFQVVMSRVLQHDAVLGNVEAELGVEGDDAGCGCAYPDSVDSAVVERSNRIHARLKSTAARYPEFTARLDALPMFARYKVGDCRVGVVHGDADSLAGWRFSRTGLAATVADLTVADWLDDAFAQAQVEVFASSHTCEPVLHQRPHLSRANVVINNGAAGMPNFMGQLSGVITRISLTPFQTSTLPGVNVIERVETHGVEVAAISVPYDHEHWRKRFLDNWPEGSEAYISYYLRIMGNLS
jgi:hypothetical protein